MVADEAAHKPVARQTLFVTGSARSHHCTTCVAQPASVESELQVSEEARWTVVRWCARGLDGSPGALTGAGAESQRESLYENESVRMRMRRADDVGWLLWEGGSDVLLDDEAWWVAIC